MSTEAKMGMGIVVILMCAFGFLVYHKFDLKQRALLQANLQGTSSSTKKPAAKQQPVTPQVNLAVSDDAIAPRADSQPDFRSTASVQLAADTSEVVFPSLDEPTPPEAEQTLPTETEDPFAVLVAANEARQDQHPVDLRRASIDPEFSVVDVTTPSPADTDQFQPFAGNDSLSDTQADERPFSRSATPAQLAPAADDPGFPVFESLAADEPEFPAPGIQLPPADVTIPVGVDLTPSIADIKKTHTEAALPPANLFPTEPSAFADVDISASTNEFTDAEPEFLPDVIATTAEPDTSQLLAMVEPRQDANLFEDDPASTQKSPPTFPVAEEPTMPELKSGSDRSTAVPLPVAVPEFGLPPQPVLPPASNPNFFSEPLPEDKEFKAPETRPHADSVRYPSTIQIPAGTQPPARGNGLLNVPATTVDTWEPGDGVAHLIKRGQIQQVAGTTEECDICEVKPNDTYWTISKRAYGTARYFSSLALYNQNRIPDPKKLRPGMKVIIPDPALLEERYPEFFKHSQPKSRLPSGYFLQADGTPAYRIGDRETLSEISQKHLGRASRWIQIFQMNRHILKDPNKLKQGSVIGLPDDATDVHLAP
nr:LysM domain protein [uncultured bacterium]